MSSKSFINLCSALTLARFSAEIVLREIKEDHSSQKILRLARRIVSQVGHARSLWPDCDASDLVQIACKIEHLGDVVLSGTHSMTRIIAMSLAQLCDMEPRLKRERRMAVNALIDSMMSLNREFDGRLEDASSYEFATRAVSEWYEVIGM